MNTSIEGPGFVPTSDTILKTCWPIIWALAHPSTTFIPTDLQHDVPCMACYINLIKIQFVDMSNTVMWLAGSSRSTEVDQLFGIAYNKRVRDCSEAIHNHP